MRVVHTSDWHLGLESWSQTRSINRLPETQKALNTLVEYVKKENIDLVLIAGDVLHNRVSPRIEALDTLARILQQLSNEAPTILLLGNHDWRGLKMLRELNLNNLFVVDKPEILEIGDFKVFAMPHLDTQRALDFGADPVSEAEKVVKEILANFSKEATSSKKNILLSHVMVEGSIESERERNLQLHIKKSFFSSNFDYIALGHIHNQSLVTTQPVTWYCGSPICLDFGEEHDKKGALVVDFSSEEPKVTQIELPRKALMTLTLENYRESTLDAVAKKIATCDGYVRIVGKTRPSNEIRKYLMNSFENIVKVEFEHETESVDTKATLFQSDVLKLYSDYINHNYTENAESMLRIFKRFLEEVEFSETPET